MKIAIVHPYPVHSRAVGGTTRVYALVKHLAARHSVEVLTHSSSRPEEDAAAVTDLARLGVPHRCFARPRATPPRKLAWMLSSEPYFVGHNRNPSLAAYLAERDRAGELDLVHLEFGYLEPLLHGLGSRPARILAEQETMSLMLERLRHVPGAFKSAYQLYIVRELRAVHRFERDTLPRFDRAFAITPEEAGLFTAILGRPAPVLPHVVEAERFTPPVHEPTAPVCLFVGNFAHDPNRFALRWLLAEPWPEIRARCAGARLEIVGPELPPEDRRLAEEAGATVPRTSRGFGRSVSPRRRVPKPDPLGRRHARQGARSLRQCAPGCVHAARDGGDRSRERRTLRRCGRRRRLRRGGPCVCWQTPCCAALAARRRAGWSSSVTTRRRSSPASSKSMSSP